MVLTEESKDDLVEEESTQEITKGDEIAISVKNLTMEFKVSKDKIDTVKEYVIRTLKRTKAESHKIKVLEDISFDVYKGDRLGILGFNGAGKSTLLKIVSGIYEPTEGEVTINGKIAPLLELGAGFDNNYSGKNNIFLNAAFLSIDQKFIEEKYEEILEFSELGEFINYPVKNYSSGMRAKLGFSIATMINPDILIIDEILSVGDIKFKKKSADKIKSLMGEGVTVLLVSHSVNQIRDICNKCIWIEKGHLVMKGDSEEVCDAYEEYAAMSEDKKDLWVNIEGKDAIERGDYITVQFKESEDGKPLVNKKITVYEEENRYIRNTNEYGKLGILAEELGDRHYKLKFKGDKEFNPKTITFDKEIVKEGEIDEYEDLVIDENKINPHIHVDGDETINQGDYISIYFNEESEDGDLITNEQIDVYIDGVKYTRDINEFGKVGLKTEDIGTHKFKIVYLGNDRINPEIFTFTKTVVEEEEIFAYEDRDMDENKINSVILVDDVDNLYLGDTIGMRFIDEDGNPIENAKATIYINGVKFKRVTNEFGKIGLITTDLGTNNIKINFHGTNEINPKTLLCSRTVVEEDEVDEYTEKDMDKDKINSVIHVDEMDNLYLGDTIRMKFEDENGNPIENAKATIYINGVKFKRVTNEFGKIGLITTDLGTNNIKINFHGTDEINPKTLLCTKTVVEEDEVDEYTEKDMDEDKLNPWIVVEGEETIEKGDKIRFRFLKKEKGKGIANARVTVYVNGVKFNRVTNKFGGVGLIATETGSNEFKVNFHGTDEINPKTIKFTKDVIE